MLAEVLDRPVDLAVQVIVGRARDRDLPGLAELLQPGGDVDPVAEQIAVRLDHHVAEVDPDPQHDPALGRHPGLPLGHGPLQGGGAGHGVDRGAELGEDAVAHELDEAAAVLGQQRVE